jgi:tetratricopeptide (TPR) repeat protein
MPCLIYLYVRVQVIASTSRLEMPFFENPLLGAGFWTARMTAIKTIGRYFGLMIWPARLSWDYGYNEVPLFGWRLNGWQDWEAIVALAGCALAAVIAVRSWRSRKPVFFAIAFFFAALSPTSNLVILIGATMAERILYLPSVGFAIAAVWILQALSRRLSAGRRVVRYFAGAALGVVLLGFAARTYDRNGDWLDPQRFWLSGVAAAPDSYKTNLSVAVAAALVTRQDVARAIACVDRALAMLDGLPDAKNSASAYDEAGVFFRVLGDRSASNDSATLAAADHDPQYWYRKSLAALLRSERLELVYDAQYRAVNARRGGPGLTSLPSTLYLDLGRIYSRLSDPSHAIAAYERGRELESSPELLEELASLYRAQGELHKAAMALVEALVVDLSQTQAALTVVELYRQIDPHGCAVTRQGGVASLNLDCPLVHGDICAASRNVIGNYLRRGQQDEADAIRRVAGQNLGCANELLKQP